MYARWSQSPIVTARFFVIAAPMGNVVTVGGETPMMPSVPALATACTARSSTWGPTRAATAPRSRRRSPEVISAMSATGSSAPKSTTSAPCALAAFSRSGIVSTAMTRPAPRWRALQMANRPTEPQPTTRTTSPWATTAMSAP